MLAFDLHMHVYTSKHAHCVYVIVYTNIRTVEFYSVIKNKIMPFMRSRMN